MLSRVCSGLQRGSLRLKPSSLKGWWSWLSPGVSSSEKRRPDEGCKCQGSARQAGLFVSAALCPEVLQRGHASRLVCLPGIRRTLFAIRQRFWWPTLAADVRQFVLACPTSTQCKPVNRHPDGLLHPLPIPSCPWTHIDLGFVSGLPPSKGNTVILTVVDHF